MRMHRDPPLRQSCADSPPGRHRRAAEPVQLVQSGAAVRKRAPPVPATSSRLVTLVNTQGPKRALIRVDADAQTSASHAAPSAPSPLAPAAWKTTADPLAICPRSLLLEGDEAEVPRPLGHLVGVGVQDGERRPGNRAAARPAVVRVLDAARLEDEADSRRPSGCHVPMRGVRIRTVQGAGAVSATWARPIHARRPRPPRQRPCCG